MSDYTEENEHVQKAYGTRADDSDIVRVRIQSVEGDIYVSEVRYRHDGTHDMNLRWPIKNRMPIRDM